MAIIAMDIDGVVSNFISAYLNDWNLKHKTNFKAKHMTDWSLESILGKTGDIIWDDIHKKQMIGFFNTLQVYPGARFYTNKLKEDGHKIYAVTNRICASDTYEWLKRNYIAFDKLYLTADKSIVYKHTNVAIDDNYDNLIDAIKQANLGILFSRPWNKSAKENIVIKRAKNWKGVYNLINEFGR